MLLRFPALQEYQLPKVSVYFGSVKYVRTVMGCIRLSIELGSFYQGE